MRPSKRLGQNFLTCRDIAEKEAKFALGKKAVEIGPGMGMLTHELCKTAKSVLVVEIHKRLYGLAKDFPEKNLKVLNRDFFQVGRAAFRGCDILVSNIPYNLSSKTLMWLFDNGIEAVLCLQREFAEHMLSKPSTGKYSRLSVFASLFFDVSLVAKVPASCFYPMPKVDSCIVHLMPKRSDATKGDMGIISLLMTHKKKKLRNALLDSSSQLKMSKQDINKVLAEIPFKDRRPFQMSPNELLDASRQILKGIS